MQENTKWKDHSLCKLNWFDPIPKKHFTWVHAPNCTQRTTEPPIERLGGVIHENSWNIKRPQHRGRSSDPFLPLTVGPLLQPPRTHICMRSWSDGPLLQPDLHLCWPKIGQHTSARTRGLHTITSPVMNSSDRSDRSSAENTANLKPQDALECHRDEQRIEQHDVGKARLWGK